MTLLAVYQSQGTEGKRGELSRALLTQTHWFTVNSVFDPMTGEALPQALSTFLSKVAWSVPAGTRCYDRLWRITDHARPSLDRLFRALCESPRREQALMPVHAVRELDANSFIKLSNRPGRNIREKLAGKPYLQAVRRFQSVNLPENRLLKAFATRLEELLELRRDCLGEVEDSLLSKIQLWLRSDEAQSIGHWDNLPPNNTLLSHRDYRRVWDAWRRLQTLDEDIARDFSQLEVRDKTMRLWNKYGQMYFEGKHLFSEMPVLFDYDKFEIRPWLSKPAFQKVIRKIARPSVTEEVFEPVCIDLTALRPRYATTNAPSKTLCETYLWQQWNSDVDTVDIELFNSDAAYLHPDATSLSSTDLFFSKENARGNLNHAARTFSSKLREIFKNNVLLWLVPDFLNDFELGLATTRRNLNSRFPSAEPLPRSVAAVFEQVDYSKITRQGFPILVVDTIGGVTCVTKLITKLDPELKKRVPETQGFFWERCPPIILSHKEEETSKGRKLPSYDIITVDAEGQWNKRVRTKKRPPINPDQLKHDPRIEQFEICIHVNESPVTGGSRLHDLQQRAGNIPLWRDQIPELSIKVMKDGLYQRFYLVSRGTTVNPVRGFPVPISVRENFTLPAGKPFYEFPLFQGKQEDTLGFSARLDSPVFPLKSDVVCELSLTFTYGADEPYKLSFVPLDMSFKSVRVTWKQTKDEIVTDAPAPIYPKPLSWRDLQKIPKPRSTETSDLLEWIVTAIDWLDRDLFIRPRPRRIGILTTDWRIDRNGYHYAKAKYKNLNEVFIHEQSFVENATYSSFKSGDRLSFELQKNRVRKVAHPEYEEKEGLRELDDSQVDGIIKNIRKRIYFPMIKIWGDGRSVDDQECPRAFANAVSEILDLLAKFVSLEELNHEIRRELLFLLACTHEGTRKVCVEWLVEQIASSSTINARAIGFALGDLRKPWQRYLFELSTKGTIYFKVIVSAFAIWRTPRFIEQLTLDEILPLLDCVLESLERLAPQQGREGSLYLPVQPLELLLGLLRTRASDDPEIKMLLQPHQKITKRFAQLVERVTEIIVKSNIELFSRVQLDLKKPTGDRTPDLLYALRLYLTGDDGANSIRITKVSDSDND